MSEIPPDDALPPSRSSVAVIPTPHRFSNHPALAALGEPVRFGRRETILDAGTPASVIYQLRSGTARQAILAPDGRRQIVSFPRAGALLGSFGGGLQACSAEALTAVEAIRFDRAALEALAEADTSIAFYIAHTLAGELVSLQRHVSRLGRLSAEARVAGFLLTQGPETDSHSAARGPVLHLAMDRRDIGDHLGLSVETVSRVLHGLRHARVLAFGRFGVIRIRNPDRLIRLAGGDASARGQFRRAAPDRRQ